MKRRKYVKTTVGERRFLVGHHSVVEEPGEGHGWVGGLLKNTSKRVENDKHIVSRDG